jgi:hypothetical protein
MTVAVYSLGCVRSELVAGESKKTDNIMQCASTTNRLATTVPQMGAPENTFAKYAFTNLQNRFKFPTLKLSFVWQ